MASHPGEGVIRCLADTVVGQRCANMEIDGLEYCLHHMPEDLLEEAEEITGVRRCRKRLDDGRPCTYYAKPGTDPPACKDHGANAGSWTSQLAANRVIEGRITAATSAIAQMSVEDLLTAPPEDSPLDRLLEMCGVAAVFEQIARRVVTKIEESNWRYAAGAGGEQTRAELLAWERAIERVFSMNERAVKLDYEGRRTRIQERDIEVLMLALDVTLAATNLTRVEQEETKRTLRKEIMKRLPAAS